MTYSREFFDLQIHFARAVAARSGIPLERALLDYTNLYIRFGLGRDFDPAHPEWQAYISGLQPEADPGEWTYRFFLTRPASVTPPGHVATFGCFSYARTATGEIRVHFANTDRSGSSPLALARCHERRAELSAMFGHIRRGEPGALRGRGVSWLYNLEAYRRLFPKAYLETAHAIPAPYRHMPLWGQFVDRHGAVRPGMAAEFRSRLASQTSVEDLDRCFPLPTLSLEAPVTAFYEHYGV